MGQPNKAELLLLFIFIVVRDNTDTTCEMFLPLLIFFCNLSHLGIKCN